MPNLLLRAQTVAPVPRPSAGAQTQTPVAPALPPSGTAGPGRVLQPPAPAGSTSAPVNFVAGFGSGVEVQSLTDLHGSTFYPGVDYRTGLFNQCFIFFVEQALSRVSGYCYNGTADALTAIATGLSTPTDIVAPNYFYNSSGTGNNPFGSFLYVTESGANKITTIDTNGNKATFASFASAPKRMAFSPGTNGFVKSSFAPNFVYVTLADGSVKKVDPNGNVTNCVSGLSAPDGLVFGGGGNAYKDTLFVADTAANKIFKIDSSCSSATVFASTGLSSPHGLTVSPGGPFGPTSTLYVADGSGKIDRVDTNGNVTGFASGFALTDSVAFSWWANEQPSIVISQLSYYYNLWIGDANPSSGAGSVSYVYPFFPFTNINAPSTSCANSGVCHSGDTLSFDLNAGNPSPLNINVKVKAGFVMPDGSLVPYTNDSPILLPQGFTYSTTGGGWLSLSVPSGLPPGKYAYAITLSEPELGFLYTSNLFSFFILP
jgi:hypothetical protein